MEIAKAFVVPEPEHPALDDRSAGTAAVLVLRQLRLRGAGRGKDIPRLQGVIAVELPCGSVQRVRAALRDDVHDRPRVTAEFRAVRVRLDLELLDRVRRRPHDEPGVERVVVARAVEQKVVGLRPHAVDAEARRDCAEPSRRGVAGAAAERWRRCDDPGHERPSWVKLRPFSGSSTSFWWSMVIPRVAWAVSISGVSARTVTPSETPPTVSFRSTRVVSPTDTSAFSSTTGLNPASVAFTEYSPG